MNSRNSQKPLYAYLRWEFVGPCIGITVLFLTLYFLGVAPADLYLAIAGLAGGVVVAEIAWAFRERDLQMQVASLELQLQVIRESAAPVLGRPEPRLSDAAYHLGELATSLVPLHQEQPFPRVEVHLAFIRGFCEALGLSFSADESSALNPKGADDFDPAATERVIISKAQSLRRPLLAFFQLGNNAAWLQDQIEHIPQTQQFLGKLRELKEDLFLGLDPQYSQVVDALIEACEPYRAEVADGDRESLRSAVKRARAQAPGLATPWFWAQEDGAPIVMRIVGPYEITGRSDGTEYEVAKIEKPHSSASPLTTRPHFRWLPRRGASRGRREEPVIVTRTEAGWRCSAHPQRHPAADYCWEVCLVLDATDGGQPVTEAALIPVRLEAAEPDGAVQPGE